MKFSTTAVSLFAATALAFPLVHEHNAHKLAKRAVVTEIVHETQTFYQKQVIYVDQNGNPFSTGFQVISTQVAQAPATTESTAAAEPTTESSAPAETTSTSEVVVVQSSAVVTAEPSTEAPSTTDSPAPSTTTAQSSQNDEIQVVTVSDTPTSTSEYVAPTTSEEPTTSSTPVETSVYVAPTTEPASTTLAVQTVESSTAAAETPAAAETSSSSDSSDSADSASSSSGGDFSGDGTYYATGLGACGITNTDSDFICAISHELFDSVSTGNPNTNPLCGKKLTATRNGKSVTVTVTDRCPGCSYYSLDFSPAAYDVLGTEEEGRIEINWSWD